MTADTYTAVVSELSLAGQLQKQPLVAEAAKRSAHRHAELSVDLGQLVAQAEQAQAPTIEIFADTAHVSAANNIDLRGATTRVTLICRRLVVEKGATISIGDGSGKSAHMLRLLARDVVGPLQIVSNHGATSETYDLSALSEPTAVPTFNVFGHHDNKASVRHSKVPTGYLDKEHPLHLLLAADYDVAAGALSTGDTNAGKAQVANDVLSWLVSWSGLRDDVAQLGRVSQRLRALAPSFSAQPDRPAQFTSQIPIPEFSTATYLKLATSRAALASQIEADRTLLKSGDSLNDLAQKFVQANIQRDRAEIQGLDARVAALQKQEESLAAALNDAASSVSAHQYQAKMDTIEIQLQAELDKIDKIVKASFDIAIGLITLGASIAAICLGVPADPSASAKKDIDGVKGLIDTLQDNINMGDGVTWAEHGRNLLFLFKVPFTFIWKNKSTMSESFKALGSAGLAIKNAASVISSSGNLGEHLDDLSALVGTALHDLANKPPASAARAAWDALELATINELDRTINDSNTAAGIKDAATAYKTTVQKIALYGRLMVEHQAAIDAIEREIGGLLLQRLAQLQKEKELAKLQTQITSREELNAIIEKEVDARLNGVARSFFSAAYGFRRAQFYEHYSLPATLLTMPRTAADMLRICADLNTDQANANDGRSSALPKFSKNIDIKDPGTLAELMETGMTTIQTSPGDLDLAQWEGIRLTTVQAHFVSPSDPTGTVKFSLTSGGSFQDGKTKVEHHFTGAPANLPFEYSMENGKETVELSLDLSGTRPPPYSEWIIRVRDKGGIDNISAVTLNFKGTTL